MKKSIVIGALVLTLGLGTYSVSALTSSEKLSKLTKKSVEEIIREKEDKTYGQVAKENGVLEEFKKYNLDKKKEILDQKVKDGTITQERAEEIYNTIKSNIENCDGTGQSKGTFKGLGLGLGRGNGLGQGLGRNRKAN